MAVYKKSNKYQGLKDIQVLEDEFTFISKYFQVLDRPTVFPQGKSSILIAGSDLLKPGVELRIEILDSAGNTIYTEPVANYLEGAARRVSIEIYPDTTPGDGTIYIVGELDPTKNTVPPEWLDVYNVRWSQPILINTSAINVEPIFFYKQPTMTVTELVKGFINITYQSSSLSQTGTSSGDTISGKDAEKKVVDTKTQVGLDIAVEKNKLINKRSAGSKPGVGARSRTTRRSSPEIELFKVKILADEEEKFGRKVVGGTLTIADPIIDKKKFEWQSYYQTSSYVTTIKDIENETTLIPKEEFTVTDTRTDEKLVAPLADSSYEITYTPEPTYSISTVNFRSFADIRLKNLRTFSGDVARVKLYAKSEGTRGDFELLVDTPVESPELLTDPLSSTGVQRAGYILNQDVIDNYWVSSSGKFGSGAGDLTVTTDSSIILDAMYISGSNYAFQNWLRVEQSASVSMSFEDNVDYTFTATIVGQSADKLDAAGSRSNKAEIAIHLSGSAFGKNHELGTAWGNELGILTFDNVPFKNFGVVEHTFTPDLSTTIPSGSGVLQFRVVSGNWYLSDISVQPAAQAGFSPDYVRIVTPLPVLQKRPDNLDFIAEFYDPNNNVAETVAFANDVNFEGENLVMYGGDNVLSGAMCIGNSIGTGIEMAGFNSGYIRSIGYEGFEEAIDGSGGPGFMMFSGSVLKDSANSYAGVGLELHGGGTNGSLRFRTNPSVFEVIAESFFVGDSSTQFISGAEGNIEISSSGFWLTPDGNVYISGSITAASGSIGGWTIGTTKLYATSSQGEVSLDSSLRGLSITDNSQYRMVAVTDRDLGAITGSPNILLNSGFETGSAGSSATLPNWQWSITGDVTQELVSDESVSSNSTQSVVFGTPTNYNQSGQYQLYQELTGSFTTADSMYATLVAKISHSLQADINRDNIVQQFAMYYEVTSGSTGLVKFYPSSSNDFDTFNVGTEYSTNAFLTSLPVSASLVRVLVSGSIATSSVATGKLGFTDVFYDTFHLSAERPRVEMSPEGFLIYGSPRSYIKLTKDGIDIKGGRNFSADQLDVNITNIAGRFANTGEFSSLTIPPSDNPARPVEGASGSGIEVPYSRWDHYHKLPFSTVNAAVSSSTFDQLHVDRLVISSSFDFSGSAFPISGALRVSASDDSYFVGSGNVGIGTIDPQTKLHVVGTVSSSGLNLGDSDISNITQSIYQSSTHTEVPTALATYNATVPRSLVNGSFIETFNCMVTSDGTNITASLQSSVGGDLTMQFSDGLTTLDCTPSASIQLTVGTIASPQENFVYVPFSTKTLTKSTTAWPGEEHIKVSYFLVQTAAYVADDGAVINQNWNDHLAGDNGQGHLLHMAERSRRMGAIYASGCDPAGSDNYLTPTAGSVTVQVGSGVIYQMHTHNYGAKDTSAGDDIHVVNHPTTAYSASANLYNIDTDASGGTLTNKYFNIMIWGVANKGGEYSPLMVNLPTDSYNTLTSAQNDVSGFDVLDIPREFNIESSTGFTIARITCRKSGGTWVVYSWIDLRGKDAFTAAGAGSTTPSGSIVAFPDDLFKVYDNLDTSKFFQFTLDSFTTSTSYAYIPPKGNGTLALLDGITGGQALYGGDGSGDNLTIAGTSHATPGYVFISGSVGIGTVIPLYDLDIRNTSSGSGSTLLISGSNFSGQESAFRMHSGQTTGLFQFMGAANTAGTLLGVNRASTFFITTGGTYPMYLGTQGATYIGLSTNSIERMRILSGGNVGIGTTDPAEKLDVSGSIKITETTGQLLLPLSNDPATPTIAFGDGNTGFYEAADNSIYIANAGAAKWQASEHWIGSVSSTGGLIKQTGMNSTTPSFVPAGNDLNTGIGSAGADQLSLIAGGSEVMRLSTVTEVYTNLQVSNAAGAKLLNEAATSTNPTLLSNRADADTGIGWAGADTGSLIAGGTNVLNWTTTGNVGIGTIAPQALLHLSSSGADAVLRIESGPSGNDAEIHFRETPTDGFNFIYDGGVNKFIIDSTDISNILVMERAIGNVGIGTASPAAKLHVWGNISGSSLQIQSSASFAGTISGSNLDISGTSTFAGVISGSGDLFIDGNIRASGFKAAMVKTPEGQQLTQVALEGNEIGIYFRGESDTNVIECPDYWKWLVDSDSITAQITPVEFSQQLYVSKVKDYKIYIKRKGFKKKLHYYYNIYGVRKDINKLEVQ